MNYHLYFHDDFDGMASGAVMLNFLRSRGDDIISYNPIDYTPKVNETWVRFKFKKPFILVDFRYHPAASWWFDHHRSSFTAPALSSWGKSYKADKTHQSDSGHKSCCSLILAHLKKHYYYKPPRHILELVKEVDIIDGALYKSPAETIELRSPAIKLGAYIYHEKSKNRRVDLINDFSNKALKEILSFEYIINQVKNAHKQLKSSPAYVKRNFILRGSAVFVDGAKVSSDISHYMIYYLFPKIKYSVISEKIKGGYHLGAGFNRWQNNKFCADISRIMEKYGGGGHKTVGAVEKRSKKEIMKIAEEVIEYLNKHG